MKKPSRFRRRSFVVPLVAVMVLLLAAGAFAFIRNHNDKTDVPVETASQSTKGEPAKTSSPSSGGKTTSSSSDTSQPGDQKSSSAGPVANLLDPSGEFVSAHHVHPSTVLTSVCNTSPGVNCVITFTSGATTKTLQSEVTDRGGSAYWNSWTPQSIGLSAGTWTIQAVASTTTQSKTANDALALEVTP